MSNKKITRRKPAVKQSAPGAQPAGLTAEEAAYIKAYQGLVQKLGLKVAKAFIGPAATWEQGTRIIDQQTTEIAEDIIRRFKGLLGFADLVSIFGAVVGYQAGTNVAKGMPPMSPNQFNEASGLFKAATQLIYTSTIKNADQKVQAVKKMPKLH